ncbi:hypothetical protein R77564_03929 [Ralstonia sp. LMG 32965]|uniref:Tyr recombinase domain-containing protein n=2 Tax=Ralstonia flatus TaxID=3058601 RepID=A0ABN9KHE6_9RALS|nr:hypothetical protein R77564_03929 [Ralstonia sp. LMG 32965]
MTRAKRTYSPQELARKLVSSVVALGKTKSSLGALLGHVIVSIGTARCVEQCVREFLTWRLGSGTGIDAPVTRAELEQYLMQESQRWRQKTLDQHRQALSLLFCVTLPNLEAEIPTFTIGRAYTREEMEQIARCQSEPNALGTRIAFSGGLRASELIELREAHELDPESNRPWRHDLFLGLPEGFIYRTTGKGGLARRVWVPLELHEQLQLRRLETPASVVDRKVRRTRVFDIGGGQSLSESFSSSSIRTLGFSLGLHGLRHSYAQNRVEVLLTLGLAPLDCLEIVSQELGHLRPDISLAYTPRRKNAAQN